MTPISDFVTCYGLPEGWNTPECFSQEIEIAGYRTHLAGLILQDDSGEQLTASAAEPESPPWRRCFYELLERLAVSLVYKQPRNSYALSSKNGDLLSLLPHEAAFPVSADPTRWQYSRSNGVAAGSDWAQACESARYELLERDRILASWLGLTKPEKATHLLPETLHTLASIYEWQGFLFPPASPVSTESAAGVFGFPLSPEHPLVYGFACRANTRDAMALASRECLQRLGFLWGEELPSQLPPFSPQPDYHQEYFLHASGAARLRNWLEGGFIRELRRRPSPATPEEIGFIDLTPPVWRGKLFVAKALSSQYLPLHFGSSPYYREVCNSELREIHPIA